MNIKKIFILFVLLVGLSLQAQKSAEPTESIKQLLEEKLNAKIITTPEVPVESEAKLAEKKYSFNFPDTPLVDVIHQWASEAKKNVLLPQGSQAITTKLKYSLPYKVTLEQFGEELNKIIEFLGYSWEEQKDNQLTLLKIDANIQREPLTLYRNPPLEELPDNGQVITAIFYLSNLKVKDPNSPIEPILKGPNGMLSPTASLKIDEKTNAIIITDKSNTIRAAMTIIRQLDLEGIPDDIQVIPLYYVQAAFVEDLFKKLLATAPQGATAPGTRETGGKTSSYFPPNTKVLGLSRTNTIVIMGSTRAIRIVKEFIIKYIDHPLDSGKSILHVYDLQYLNAEEFAPILQQLVNKTETGQAQTQAQAIGPRRDFQDVIVEAEKTSITAAIAPTTAEGAPAAAVSEGVQQGGNRLIIAARREDWRRIKKLIKQLDTPQPQVAIEVLVVDLNMVADKIVGDQMRNKSGFNSSVSNNVNFQTANLTTPIITPAIGIPNATGQTFDTFSANALASNLFQFITDNTNLANSATPGSLLISFNDSNGSGIWNVLQVLDKLTNNTILTQPFIVTTDNKQATISLSQDRLLAGGANSDGGSITVKNEYVTAATAIDILPTISVGTKNINLQINITVNTFLTNANNRATRLVQTNANVGDGEVLALGGLITTNETITEFDTPLLSKIPLIGWLFKRREKVRNKTNLMIFISPRIIQPRIGGGADRFTENKLCLAENDLQEEANFEDLRDPITRWFFKPNVNFAHDSIDDYVEIQSAYKVEPKEVNERKKQIKELEKMISGEDNPLLKIEGNGNQTVLNTK
jgi:general secretion pathway protein D